MTGHGLGRDMLRLIEGGARPTSAVPRLHRFQAEHPQVEFTAPHLGGRGRYLARIPAGTLPGDSREHALSSVDLTGLMDQLDDLFGLPG